MRATAGCTGESARCAPCRALAVAHPRPGARSRSTVASARAACGSDRARARIALRRQLRRQDDGERERFDPAAFTMAHRTLPFGTRVRVTNLKNHRSVEVRVNDRGPAVRGRIGDVSLAAARALGMTDDGVIDATLEVIDPGAD